MLKSFGNSVGLLLSASLLHLQLNFGWSAHRTRRQEIPPPASEKVKKSEREINMGNPKLRAHRPVEHRQHTTDTGPTRPHLGRGLGVGTALEELVLEGHIALGLEADAGAEDVGESGALLSEGVDHGGAGRRERRLEHVAQHAQHAVEALEVVGRGRGRDAALLDPRHHLRH